MSTPDRTIDLEALARPVKPSKPFLDNELWILEEARRRGSEEPSFTRARRGSEALNETAVQAGETSVKLPEIGADHRRGRLPDELAATAALVR